MTADAQDADRIYSVLDGAMKCLTTQVHVEPCCALCFSSELHTWQKAMVNANAVRGMLESGCFPERRQE